MDEELIYVYCISDSRVILNDKPDWQHIKCLEFGSFYAIVKFVSPNDFSEENLKNNFGNLLWIDKHAREHILIISELMKKNTVIPFKFGTIFNSEKNLGRFVEDYSVSLKENIINIAGKQEWAVKIYCHRPTLNRQIVETNEDIIKFEQEIQKSTPGKAFLLKRKKTELVEKEVEKVMGICGQSGYEKLNEISDMTTLNKTLPKDVTERQDDMILNLACLISEDNLNEFNDVIAQHQEKYRNSGLTIEISGPWPSFSFIRIVEK